MSALIPLKQTKWNTASCAPTAVCETKERKCIVQDKTNKKPQLTNLPQQKTTSNPNEKQPPNPTPNHCSCTAWSSSHKNKSADTPRAQFLTWSLIKHLALEWWHLFVVFTNTCKSSGFKNTACERVLNYANFYLLEKTQKFLTHIESTYMFIS